MLVRWIGAVATGVAVALVVALLALLLSPVEPRVSAVVLGATALPIGVALGWLLLVAPRTVPRDPHDEDSVEGSWMRDALSGTATDIVLVAGIALAIVAITRAEVPAQLVLIGVLLVAFASTVVRYTLARVRALRA